MGIVETEPAKGVSAEYLKINKLGKVPTFVGADGYTLHECIAIAIYITSQNEKTTLLGKTKQDYAAILKWMSFFNTEILPTLGGWFRPLIGRDPYNKKSVDESSKAALKAVSVVDEHLQNNTYLAGERITLADLFAAVVDPLAFIDEAIKNQAPKKPEQPKKEAAPKAAPKPKAKAAEEEEEEEVQEAPKAKHPLESLSKPTIPLDEWKRQYSNSDIPVALKWFWENFNAEDYSIWRVDYKYNEELTQVFMTSNLIGGFFARLEGSRNFILGCAPVYGVKDDSVIQGAFVIRGQEALPAFDVAPDYESYEFTKLDPTKAEDKEFVNDQWTWEKPVTVNGKEYPWADGKVFK